VQLFPHDPQFVLSACRFVSQPSRTAFSFALQLPHPASQLIPHAPPTQLGTPWLELHGVVHPPQVLALVLVSVSQPSRVAFSFALQSPHPPSHAITHAAPTQLGVPWLELHAAPHAPQCAAVVARSVSQPASAVQSPHPAAHAYWQPPSEHPVATMCAGAFAAHEYPHAPQFNTLVFVSVSHPSDPATFSSPLQSLHPPSHVCSQLPVVHTGAECAGTSSHPFPHVPQLLTSLPVAVSQPFRLAFSFALQSVKPGRQLAMLHALAVHAGVPFTLLHGKLHAAQCASSVVRSVSQPAAPVQSPYPLLHPPSWHVPTLQ